jgi:hypothetical protein
LLLAQPQLLYSPGGLMRISADAALAPNQVTRAGNHHRDIACIGPGRLPGMEALVGVGALATGKE